VHEIRWVEWKEAVATIWYAGCNHVHNVGSL
jgi:hypothetical protein